MIVTVTPNPSLDRTVEIDALVRGDVLRARRASVEAGGKGVNISRALAANGIPTLAVLPSGGFEGAQLTGLLATPGVEVVLVRIAGAVRANISIVEPDGTVTKINEPGPELTTDEFNALSHATLRAAAGADWLAASGSLPPGASPDFYARLIELLAPTSCRIAVDSSGEPLLRVLGMHPDVVKPNRDELAEAVGGTIATLGDAVEAAGRLQEKGPRAVLASLGADGAILVDASGALHGEAYVDTPVSAVGAGDSLLAGFLAGGGSGRKALIEGLAWGAAAVTLPGSRVPGPSDLRRDAVLIHSHIDRQRRLKGVS
jgi:1-phosphofructokinase